MKKRVLVTFVFVLLFAFSVCLVLISFKERERNLEVSFLNIGQGDAIFIEAPNGANALIDAGPGREVLGELGAVMMPFDKKIDIAMITNPDKDHIEGFVSVFDRYDVEKVFYPGTQNPTPTSAAVEEKIKSEGAEKILARRGQRIVLDPEEGVYIDILFPDKDVSGLSSNDGSIVAKLVYGKTSVLLQGDATAQVERHLVQIESVSNELSGTILKTGHHGSRTSTTPQYVEAVHPEFAVISCGKNNRYGHPHKEVLDTLQKAGVPVLRTDLEGRITFISDGEKMWRKESFFK